LGNGGIAIRILNLVTTWRWMVRFWAPGTYWLGGPQSWFGRGGEEKNPRP